MKTSIKFVIVLLVGFLAFTSCNEDDDVLEGLKYQEFNHAMRDLWSDHGLWTRNVIINIVDGAPGTNEAVNRLLANQDDIGNAIKPYYGDQAGNDLTSLLKEHINQAAEILTAAVNDNTPAFDAAVASWYANADEIAIFLNNANPDNWALADMKAMMKEHLDLTLEEATARLDADYAADVAAFDKVYNQLMEMADMLSEGIAMQFPDKF